MKGINFLTTGFVLIPLTVFSAQNIQKKPNIIYILADDMGYSDMSWQNSSIKTPNLDRLKAEGMFLDRNYVQPQSSPSRVSLLTGNYPYRYGLHEHIVLSSSYTGIPGEVKTIAEKMKEGGYETAIIGKWHVGGRNQSYLPHNQGFDHSFVCINGGISYWNYTHSGVNDLIRNGEKVYPPSSLDSEASGNLYSTYMWANEAIDVIANRNKKQPLFLYLAFTAPHHPLNAPKELLNRYPEEKIDSYWSGSDTEKARTALSRRYYMAMVDAMDKAIGDVLMTLEKEGMTENTLIVFCSDNGGIIEADNRPLRSIKGDSFEGGIRVPGIVYWPGTVKPGSQSSELIHICDWYPTFAELAGMSCDKENIDGISAVNIILGGKGKRDVVPIISAGRHALVNQRFALVGSSENYQRSLINGLSEFQLYDLEEDVSQKKPTVKYPDIKKKMQEQFMKYFSGVNRGYFNWDIKYSKYRNEEKKTGDHNNDFVINDLPQTDVRRSGSNTSITLSPVCDELMYTLQGSADGMKWEDVDKYICREDAEKYTFPIIPNSNNLKEYRVLTKRHFGLPMRDAFSLDKAYQKGLVYKETNFASMKEFLPRVDGFLRIADVSESQNIQIKGESLSFGSFPLEGGCLELKSKSAVNPTFITRYFVEPLSQGKIFASMLIKFEALEAESVGEINWLVQNGWNGPTEKQISVAFQNDGIYCRQADSPLSQKSEKWLAKYDNKVLNIVFEFDLGATGRDELKIYINPVNFEKMKPDAVMYGEFTFDRLQFALSGRTGGTLAIDEICIGREINDLKCYYSHN